jgi:hypothetical protein
MRSSTFMSDEMIDRLFEQFKRDQHRWVEFKNREFPEQPYSKDNIEPSPGRAELVHDFVGENLGVGHGYEVAGLILKIRKAMHGFEP